MRVVTAQTAAGRSRTLEANVSAAAKAYRSSHPSRRAAPSARGPPLPAVVRAPRATRCSLWEMRDG